MGRKPSARELPSLRRRPSTHQSLRPANMGVIYKITSPSGKGYVGQTKRALSQRMHRHRDMKWGNCKLLKRAIRKYGWEQMQVQVLWTGSNEELGPVEIAMIRDHGTLAPHGYNSLPGGDVNPMSVQIGRDSVRASWANPEVRKRHRQGRLNAWQDPVKRANQMAARERVREAKIAAYPPEEQDAVRERFRRQREAQARSTQRKQLTSSKSHPSCAPGQYMGSDGQVHDEGSLCPSEFEEE